MLSLLPLHGHVLPASSQFTIVPLDGVVLGWLLRWVMQHWTGSAAGAGRPLVVEVVAVTGSAALLVGRENSLMTEFCSLHFLHGLGAVAGRRCEPLRCAASCELRAAAPRCSGLVAPSGTRGMGNPAAVERF